MGLQRSAFLCAKTSTTPKPSHSLPPITSPRHRRMGRRGRDFRFLAPRDHQSGRPSRCPACRRGLDRLGVDAASRDQPGDHRVRVPHLTGARFVPAPDRCRNRREQRRDPPGDIHIGLSGEHLASHLDVDAARIVEDLLTVTSAFQHRKRGVETRLIIGDAQPEIDATLLRNIARAHRYFDLVRSGKTFAEIAEAECVSKRRVQQLIELAFLAPDIIRAIREGRQPVGMTSDRLKRYAFSPIWTEQREAFAAL